MSDITTKGYLPTLGKTVKSGCRLLGIAMISELCSAKNICGTIPSNPNRCGTFFFNQCEKQQVKHILFIYLVLRKITFVSLGQVVIKDFLYCF